MTKESNTRFVEADIKKLITDKEKVFGDLGESAIVFEKAIMRGNTIMDCMILSEKKGVIGVEIKTERDTTRRLNKQLRDYEKVCDYVYVLCHDSHVQEVEKILKRYHSHTGILSYVEFRGSPVLGEYKSPKVSPMKSAYHMLDILWKTDIVNILGGFRSYGEKVQTATGVKFFRTEEMASNRRNTAKLGNSSNLKKPQLIYNLIGKLGGPKEATKVFCEVYIHPHQDPDKTIKYHHFNHSLIPESEEGNDKP